MALKIRLSRGGTKKRPQIVEAFGRSQDAGGARAVGADQAAGVALAQERPGLARLRDEPLDAVHRDIAARQARAPGPCRPARQDVGEPVERILG